MSTKPADRSAARSRRKPSAQSAEKDSVLHAPPGESRSNRIANKRPRDPSRRRPNPSRKHLPSAGELNRIIEQHQQPLSSPAAATSPSQSKKPAALSVLCQKRSSSSSNPTLAPTSPKPLFSKPSSAGKLSTKSKKSGTKSTDKFRVKSSHDSKVKASTSNSPARPSRGGHTAARSSSKMSDTALSTLVPDRPTRGVVRSSSLPMKKPAKEKLSSASPLPRVKGGRRLPSTRKRRFGSIRSDDKGMARHGDRDYGLKKKQRTSAGNVTRSQHNTKADNPATPISAQANGDCSPTDGAKKRPKRSKNAGASASSSSLSSSRDGGPTLRTRRSTRFAKQLAQARIFDPKRSAVTLSGDTMRQEQNRRASKLSRTWSIDEVEQWAKRLDTESNCDIAQRFATAKISGEMLCQMTAHDLRARFDIDDPRTLGLILDEVVCAHLQDFGESLTRRHGAPQRESDYHRAPPGGSGGSSKLPSSSSNSTSSSSTSSKPPSTPSNDDTSSASRQPENVTMEDEPNATMPTPMPPPVPEESYPYWVVPPFERPHVNPNPNPKFAPKRFRNRPKPRRRKGQTEDIVRTF